MIHVQIASDITTVGVEGVRWVLVEASDLAQPAAPAPSPVLACPARAVAPAAASRDKPRRVGLWQLGITCLGLLAALGLARQQLGLPKLPWLAVPAVKLPMAPPPVPVAPAAAPPIDAALPGPTPTWPDTRPPADPSASDGAMPAPLTPAASAAQPERLITAGLQ